MTKPILTIVRGLPGSGKSSYARKLAAETGAMLIEPDAMLVVGGEYVYTPKRYIEACKSAKYILKSAIAVKMDVIYADVLPTIESVNSIIDVEAYQATIYTIRVIDMPLLTVEESIAHNRHNVRREDIERMAATWEPWKVKP